MKKIILALILLAPATAFAKDASATFDVTGWHCVGCPTKTETALKKVKGVKKVATDLDKNTVTVAFDDNKTSSKAIQYAIKSAGFSATQKN